MIDVTKLIARKKFSIPVKSSSLNKLILEQLKISDDAWHATVKRSKSGTFEIDWGTKWADTTIADKGLPYTVANRRKLQEEYNKSIFKNRNQVLRRTVNSAPCSVHYVVTEEMMERCICEVTCFPTLYLKKGVYTQIDVKCNDANIQVARQRGEEFLVDIFVGGLGGKEIVERKEVSLWELLINDVDCHHVTDCIYQMLEQATGEVLLMGWVGTDCLPRLKELKNQGVTIQAVTHKPSEMKGPVPKDLQEGYTNLVKILDKTNVSTNRELHGRALIVDNKALIGSMDLNSHSLSGEHREFAIYTKDVDTVRKIRAYFKRIFVPLKAS